MDQEAEMRQAESGGHRGVKDVGREEEEKRGEDHCTRGRKGEVNKQKTDKQMCKARAGQPCLVAFLSCTPTLRPLLGLEFWKIWGSDRQGCSGEFWCSPHPLPTPWWKILVTASSLLASEWPPLTARS